MDSTLKISLKSQGATSCFLFGLPDSLRLAEMCYMMHHDHIYHNLWEVLRVAHMHVLYICIYNIYIHINW